MSIFPALPAFAACLPVVLALPRAAAQSVYSFGNPSAEEQLYIELINRARANPAAEGLRLAAITDPTIVNAYTYFNVDLAMMKAEFAALDPAPPLAPNAALTAAARGHSQWMLANDTQTHNQTNPFKSPWDRIEEAGYDHWTAGENVFASAQSVEHGHAGFEVDWGSGGPGGMQAGRGHRVSIHDGDFREIGVGMAFGSNTHVGPQLVTQDFATSFEDRSFGTGVAYYDLNGNNFYDIGEGIAGLNVSVSGANEICLTADGGGWVLPVPSNAANRTVTFSGLAISQTRPLSVPEDANAKADLRLTYQPPTILSPASGQAGESRTFEFTPVGGATGYLWQRRQMVPVGTETCDTLDNVTTNIIGTYNVLSTTVKQSGSGSFHLVNYTGAAGKQTIEFKQTFYGGAAPQIAFYSSQRYSTDDQRHLMEVKEEGSATWQTVYTQTGGTYESGFTKRTVDLPQMAGKAFRVRFAHDHVTGGYYPSNGDDYGWFVDTVEFAEISRLSAGEEELLAGTTGNVTLTEGEFLWSVTPIISSRPFPGRYQIVTVASAPLVNFASWAAGFEQSKGLPAGTLADHPIADWDNDRNANLVEYAFGTSPVVPSQGSPRWPALVEDPSALVLRYVRDTSLPDVVVTPFASADLLTWISPGNPAAPAGFSDAAISTDGTMETREARIPRTAGDRWFLRLQVTRPGG